MKKDNIIIQLIVLVTLLILGNNAFAEPITVPPGLKPGDQYRLVFVTSTTTIALDVSIDIYNDFVATVAASVPKLDALGVQWKAIASTEEMSAIDNTGTYGTGVPVYNLAGQLAAINYTYLWGIGPSEPYLSNPIKYDETGAENGSSIVWTGTNVNGRPDSGLWLGGYSGTAFYGLSDSVEYRWIANNVRLITDSASLYALSGVLEVPAKSPVPASILLLLSGYAGRVDYLDLES